MKYIYVEYSASRSYMTRRSILERMDENIRVEVMGKDNVGSIPFVDIGKFFEAGGTSIAAEPMLSDNDNELICCRYVLSGTIPSVQYALKALCNNGIIDTIPF